jgi:hypothetical protein
MVSLTNRADFVQIIFYVFDREPHLAKMCQNIALGTKVVAFNMHSNFSRSAGETEQHLLCHLLYAGAFAHCANWLVKLIPGN